MRRALLVSLILSIFTTTAAAEAPPGGYQQPEYVDPNAPPDAQPYGQDPYAPAQQQPYVEPQAYPQQQVVVEQQPTAAEGRGLQYGLTLFVPVWLGDLGEQIRPGFGIRGRLGWELAAGLSFELGLGVMWNGDDGLYVGGSLTGVNVSAGARYAILNASRLVPFIQAGVQVNVWNSCRSDGYCSDFADVTAGFFGGGGLIVELTHAAALELGLTVTGTSAGDLLRIDGSDRSFWFQLNPFVGFTLYY